MISREENPATLLDEAGVLELDNAHFVLSRVQYDAFLEKLDRPPRLIPALRELMLNPLAIDVPNN